MVRCWTALLGARERACLRASTSHGNLARNSTNSQDGLKALSGKYICPVFFIVVFQNMNLSCSWGRFWLSALRECSFTVHTANANQKATVTPECAPDQHQCYAFLKGSAILWGLHRQLLQRVQIREQLPPELTFSKLKNNQTKPKRESSWRSKQYY